MSHRLVRAAAVATLLLSFVALAHRPRFPAGAGPFPVEDPLVSKAYYMRLDPGARHVFVLAPVDTAVPLQLLVLDDEAGRLLELVGSLRCAGDTRTLTEVDQPFFEEFTRMEMRYRAVDSVGPTEGECEVEVFERRGRGGSYVLAVGSEESFAFEDLVGLLTLGSRLESWRRP